MYHHAIQLLSYEKTSLPNFDHVKLLFHGSNTSVTPLAPHLNLVENTAFYQSKLFEQPPRANLLLFLVFKIPAILFAKNQFKHV